MCSTHRADRIRRSSCIRKVTVTLTLTLMASTMATPMAVAESFEEIQLKEFLVISQVGRYGRTPIHLDPIQAAVVRRSFGAPSRGEQVLGHAGRAITWNEAKADSEGWLVHSSLRGGYAYAEVDSPTDQVMLLEASGHAMVYVNGVPRAGDPYVTGRTILPVRLQEGKNAFLFHAAAGRLRCRLIQPPAEVFFDLRDNTLPTAVAEGGVAWVGVLLVNCRDTPLPASQVSATLSEGSPIVSMMGPVPPRGVRKLAIPFDGQQFASGESTEQQLQLELKDPEDNESTAPLAGAEITLQVAGPGVPQIHTFESALDGSVQTYALLRAKDERLNDDGDENSSEDETAPGILVSLHDARSQAADHLEKYEPQDGIHILAPGGRRTEGCDWEDWHARDALESLDQSMEHLSHDPRKVWLAGDGTGGHGVWRLGTLAPDRWTALVASNAWLNFPAASRELPTNSADTPTVSLLARGSRALDLVPLLSNLRETGISMMNQTGQVEADSRKALQALAGFHSDVTFRELVGTDADTKSWHAVDSQIFSFFQQRKLPQSQDVAKVDFSTFDPAASSSSHWLTILLQRTQGELSRAVVAFDAKENRFTGEMQNVAAFALDVSHLPPDTSVEIVLDEESIGDVALTSATAGQLRFLNTPIGWQLIPQLPDSMKRPERNGGFRSAFENRAVLVYGTMGTDDENTWALEKARYDAETLLVRANASVEVIADREYGATRYANRNVVIYGNADTNSVWPQLLSTSPVQVRRGEVRIDRRPETGEDLACVFVWPQQRFPQALVGVVSGTGMAGFRATDRLPFFVNGTVFPDLLLLGADSLTKGTEEVRATGYFGTAWTIEPGEIVWRDTAL